MLILKLAWRNIWRHKRRSLITAVAMGVGVALTLAAMSLNTGMYAQMFHILVEEQIGHAQIHAKNYPKKKALYDTVTNAPTIIKKLHQLPQVVAISGRVYGYSLLGAGDEAGGAQLTGITPQDEAALTQLDDNIIEGKYLGNKAKSELILGHRLAKKLKVKVGSEVVAVTQAADGSMGNALLKVVGLFKTGAPALDNAGAFVHVKDAQDLFAVEDQVHEIAILGHGRDRIKPLLAAVSSAVGNDQLLIQGWDEINPLAKQTMEMQDASSFIMVFLIFGVAGLGILNTMLMSVFERTRELGVLIALGLRPLQVVWLVLAETVLLTGFSAFFGVVIGLILDAYLVSFGLNMGIKDGLSFGGVHFDSVIKGEFHVGAVLFTVSSLFIIALLASIWPAIRAARLRPVVAMRAL